MALTLELYDERSYSWSDKTDKCIRLRHSISSRELESIEFELIGEDVSVGQKIRVKRDNNIIFEGIVYERSRKQRGGLLSVKATAYSYLILYDRQIIYRIYQTGVKAGEIIRDLGKLIDDEFPVNLNGVEDGDSLLSPWKIENCSALEIMKSVARGTNYWLRTKPCLSYLSFPGEGEYVIVDDSPSLKPSNVSICLWIRVWTTDNLEVNTHPVFKYRYGYPSYGLRMGWGKAPIHMWIYDGSSSYYTSTIALVDHNWHFICGTYNSETGELKTDRDAGQEIKTATAPTGLVLDNPRALYIYDVTIGTGRAYDVAQVLIYKDKVLNSSEIQHNYLNPMNPITDGLVLWLNFHNVQDNIVPDLSGHGNDGTIYGASQGYEVYPQYANSMLLEFKPKVIA